MNVTLKEKEKTAVKDLQTQEKSCIKGSVSSAAFKREKAL